MKKIFLVVILLFGLHLHNAQALNMGDVVPEISAPTIDGKDFKLSSLKGKVVLMDFWATWCAPCVQEQPELKKLYEKYKTQVDSKEFEILGISLDKSKENWQKVVEKNQINWPQIGDLKFWKSPIAKAYSINELPYNLIIDGEGKIIAKNLHGEELEAFLDSVFKK